MNTTDQKTTWQKIKGYLFSIRSMIIFSQTALIIFLIGLLIITHNQSLETNLSANKTTLSVDYNLPNFVDNDEKDVSSSDTKTVSNKTTSEVLDISIPFIITDYDKEIIEGFNLTPLGTITSKDYYSNKIKRAKTKEDKILYQKTYQYNLNLLRNYIKKRLYLSKLHEKKYKIPFEITLAQGLLESNTGKSKLAKKYNNEFGLKPRNPRNCDNKVWTKVPSEDSKCWFMKFDKIDGAFKEHSERLNTERYKSCHTCNTKYPKNQSKRLECWAKGLVKCGYAEDPKYSKKLIQIIEELELSKLKN